MALTFVVDSQGVVEVVDDQADTQIGPAAQAWSMAEPIPEPVPTPEPDAQEHTSWTPAFRRASLFAAPVLIAGGLVVTVGVHHAHAHSEQPVVTTETVTETDPPPPDPLPAPEAPPVIDYSDAMIGHTTHDGDYLQTLRSRGFPIWHWAPSALVSNGHIVCRNLMVSPYHSRGYLIWWTVHYDTSFPPGMTQEQLSAFINTSADFYCPGL